MMYLLCMFSAKARLFPPKCSELQSLSQAPSHLDGLVLVDKSLHTLGKLLSKPTYLEALLSGKIRRYWRQKPEVGDTL